MKSVYVFSAWTLDLLSLSLCTNVYHICTCNHSLYVLDSKKNRKETGLRMLMVRALLGRTYLHDEDEELEGMPCRRRDCYTPDCEEHDSRFHSVVAGTDKRFLEFLLDDEESCYVQYCIEYDRVY